MQLHALHAITYNYKQLHVFGIQQILLVSKVWGFTHRKRRGKACSGLQTRHHWPTLILQQHTYCRGLPLPPICWPAFELPQTRFQSSPCHIHEHLDSWGTPAPHTQSTGAQQKLAWTVGALHIQWRGCSEIWSVDSHLLAWLDPLSDDHRGRWSSPIVSPNCAGTLRENALG